MKKSFLVIVMLLVMCSIQAQTTERQDAAGKFLVIPSVMLTYNPYSLKPMNNVDVNAKYNFQFGVGIETEYRIHEICGVALGVNYIVQGIKTSKSSGGSSWWMFNDDRENEVQLKSLRVPLFLCLHPLPNDRLTIKSGCEMQFLLDKGENYKSTAIGVPLGIAYSFDDRLQFELRYDVGVSEIIKDKRVNVDRNCFILSAGVRL